MPSSHQNTPPDHRQRSDVVPAGTGRDEDPALLSLRPPDVPTDLGGIQVGPSPDRTSDPGPRRTPGRNPLPEPNLHRMAALRNWLLDPPHQAAEGLVVPASLQSQGTESQLSDAIYPYAKGPELANEGMGYGEVVAETRWSRDKDHAEKLAVNDFISRRTKSGRQVLRDAQNTGKVIGYAKSQPAT